MAFPQLFQFANEFGITRKEGVFSTIDVRNINQQSDQECGCVPQTKKLEICESISKNCQKGVTTTLIDPETESEFEFPEGSVINQIIVVDKTCGNLSCELSFILGYLSDCIEDDTRLALLAQRSAAADCQITGSLLNTYHKLHIDQKLTGAALAAQKAIYDPEDAENGDCIQDVDLCIVNGNNYVGEPKAIKPAITVTSGELCVDDLEFFYCWTPPCPGVVWKPVIQAQPCSPKGCRGNSPCSPRNKVRFGNSNKRGCH